MAMSKRAYPIRHNGHVYLVDGESRELRLLEIDENGSHIIGIGNEDFKMKESNLGSRGHYDEDGEVIGVITLGTNNPEVVKELIEVFNIHIIGKDIRD